MDWGASLRKAPKDLSVLARSMSADFSGSSMRPVESQRVRSGEPIEVWRNKFREGPALDKNSFLEQWTAEFAPFTAIDIADFQITKIEEDRLVSAERRITTRIHFEIAGSGRDFYREQRVGDWEVGWTTAKDGSFRVSVWRVIEETRARSHSPIYQDITSAVLGSNSSYSSQLLHGSDYWRTILDGACGIDIYGHNGVSVADVDGDGLDDLYLCQPAGLPNRLYRNRGDGTFEDVTDRSGLGILENTSCALFADFQNRGLQDVILVLNNGPQLFVNDGGGRFQQKQNAFEFVNTPQGTFTGAAVADYDRDGWLDIYFCLYAYYQGTGQYKYPSPYHDAENGPPNFLMRNRRDGTFSDVTAQSGLSQNNTRYSFCCAWNDYNGDGWPDLYVVNDFGRKNLYRNNGDGTFTDAAASAGAEDVGAGMSASWSDFDNDGSPDLYVGNMWTAAGIRVASQDEFKKNSSADVRALYQKHAMGNSLLHNRDGKFEDSTANAGVGIGRWAWSSDAFDFDHDGFPDLYCTNGMISGQSRGDLNGFFWRQVVANCPDEAGASHEYEQGWSAINELIRSDQTWSGYERNVFYANNRDGTFSDVSAVVGLDFVEDGRAFALADFDQDGRVEIFLKNRNAPQVRVLKNVMPKLPPSVAFRLKGTKSNRDAIGAVITIETSVGRQVRSIQAGSGFLSQHSKEIVFGLGSAAGKMRASIRWPSGLTQTFADLPFDHRIWIEEGSDAVRAEAFRAARPVASKPATSGDSLPAKSETWLLAPVAAPDFSLSDRAGKAYSLSSLRGEVTLLNFWTSQSPECRRDLQTLQANHVHWAAKGLRVITVEVDGVAATSSASSMESSAGDFDTSKGSLPILRGSEDVAAIYNILYRQLSDRHRDMGLPTSFLIDREGAIVKVYCGAINSTVVEQDARRIPRTVSERLALALPFPSETHQLEFGRNYLSLAALYFQRGYFDQAGEAFQAALHDDPSSAEALYGIGSVYLNQNKNAEARDAFERCLKLQANYPDTIPDAWNNLGVLATRENRPSDSIDYFQHALKVNPSHVLSLVNLGNAYRVQKNWSEAQRSLERALQIAPDDPEANYSLGMVFAQTNDTAAAREHLERALKARPNYPEALNNLGVLALVTQHRDEAVARFEECIRVAPAFDQAYLNLARVYALEDRKDKAREIVRELLKQHPDHPQGKQLLEQLQN